MEEMDRTNNIKPHFFRNQAKKKQNKQQKKGVQRKIRNTTADSPKFTVFVKK